MTKSETKKARIPNPRVQIGSESAVAILAMPSKYNTPEMRHHARPRFPSIMFPTNGPIPEPSGKTAERIKIDESTLRLGTLIRKIAINGKTNVKHCEIAENRISRFTSDESMWAQVRIDRQG